MFICAPFVDLVLEEAKEGVGYPRIGVLDNCELLSEYQEPNSSSLQEQSMIFTTESSL